MVGLLMPRLLSFFCFACHHFPLWSLLCLSSCHAFIFCLSGTKAYFHHSVAKINLEERHDSSIFVQGLGSRNVAWCQPRCSCPRGRRGSWSSGRTRTTGSTKFSELIKLTQCRMPKQAPPLQYGSRTCRVEPGDDDREFNFGRCGNCRGGGG